MITNITTDSQTESSITIRVTLQPPEEGRECVRNYNVTVQVRDTGTTSNTATDTVDTNLIEVLVRDLSVCPTEYIVTAVACGRTLPCSNASVAVMYNATSGKYSTLIWSALILYHHSVTMFLCLFCMLVVAL